MFTYRFSKNYSFLLSMLVFSQMQAVSIYKISDSDIQKAKSELIWSGRVNKAIKIGVSAAAIAGLYFTFNSVMPFVYDHADYEQVREPVKKTLYAIRNGDVKKVASSITKDVPENLKLTAMAIVLKKMAIDENQIVEPVRGFFGSIFHWTKEQAYAIPGVTAMVVMPLIGESIVNKFRDIFGKRTITRLATNKLEIPSHFQRLKVSAVHWSPSKFLANSNFQDEKKLRKYAKQVLASISKTPADQVLDIRKKTKEIFIEECNTLMKDMSYIVAYIKYVNTSNKNQDLLNKFADQLQMSTYEFANRLEELLEADNIEEVFSEAALFQNTFNATINNYMIFIK